jgi:hypothetical protein
MMRVASLTLVEYATSVGQAQQVCARTRRAIREPISLLRGPGASAQPRLRRKERRPRCNRPRRMKSERGPVSCLNKAFGYPKPKYSGFRLLTGSYPQYVVDKGAGAVDKWNKCNKTLTLRNGTFAIRHK